MQFSSFSFYTSNFHFFWNFHFFEIFKAWLYYSIDIFSCINIKLSWLDPISLTIYDRTMFHVIMKTTSRSCGWLFLNKICFFMVSCRTVYIGQRESKEFWKVCSTIIKQKKFVSCKNKSKGTLRTFWWLF